MTNQEAFDKVLAHLRKQGKAAVGGVGLCQYRAEDGCMCAIGCLIPDDQYSPDMEGETVFELQSDFGLLEGINRAFLTDLQIAHDGELKDGGLKRWEVSMRGIAHKYNLTYTPLQATP